MQISFTQNRPMSVIKRRGTRVRRGEVSEMHRRTGSKIQGAAPLKTKSDGICREFKSDGNNNDILPFWVSSEEFGGS